MTQDSDKALEPADKIRALKLAVAPDDPQAARYLNEMIDDVLREVAEEAKREEAAECARIAEPVDDVLAEILRHRGGKR